MWKLFFEWRQNPNFQAILSYDSSPIEQISFKSENVFIFNLYTTLPSKPTKFYDFQFWDPYPNSPQHGDRLQNQYDGSTPRISQQ